MAKTHGNDMELMLIKLIIQHFCLYIDFNLVATHIKIVFLKGVNSLTLI